MEKQLKRSLYEILRDDIHNHDFEKISIIISEVRMSKDLKVAHIFLFPMQGCKISPLEFLEKVKDSGNDIKRVLAKKVFLRFVPELKFHLDEIFEKRQAELPL